MDIEMKIVVVFSFLGLSGDFGKSLKAGRMGGLDKCERTLGGWPLEMTSALTVVAFMREV